MFTCRVLMLLALIVWIGGIVFFAFVLAPTVFSVLPTRELAGNVVNPSLRSLHWMGIVSAVIFLICSILYNRAKLARWRPFSSINLLVLAMLSLTLISQFLVSPRMQALRAEMGTIDNVPVTDARRTEFNSLHGWSTRLESGVLVAGIFVVLLTARRLS